MAALTERIPDVRPDCGQERRRRVWIRAGAWIVCLWVLAGGATYFLRLTRPTPRSVIAFIQQQKLGGKAPEERARIVSEAALRLTRLDHEDFREVRRTEPMRVFYWAMTGEEKEQLLGITAPVTVKHILDEAMRLPAGAREEYVARVCNEGEMDITSDGTLYNNKRVEAMLGEAFGSYYRSLPPAVQKEMRPVLKHAVPVPIKGL